MKPTPELIDPQRIRVDPARLAMMKPDPESPAVFTLADAMKLHGYDAAHPLIVRRVEGEVFCLTGLNRLFAARRRQFKEVPCFVTDEDPATVILRHLGRRHLSAGARAYLALPLLDAALEAGKAKRHQNLLKRPMFLETAPRAVSENYDPDEKATLLALIGVAQRTMEKARTVRKAFASEKLLEWETPGGEIIEQTARAWFEPKLLADHEGDEHYEGSPLGTARPIGLGGILKALAGKPSQRAADPREEQLSLFGRKFGALEWHWGKIKADAKFRSAAAAQMRARMEEMDPDLVEFIAENAEKVLRKSGK